MPDLGKLVSGFRVFRSTTLKEQQDIISHLLQLGEKPTTMVISCVDLRIPPAMLFATNPGELYVVNNIGGLVPKFSETGVYGIMSAIEFAVTGLGVQNIVVLGHAKCESLNMMMSDEFVSGSGNISEAMKKWLSIASEARDAVKKELSKKSVEEQQQACEHETIIVSLRNLLGYPYIMERMEQGKLNIYGWHFSIEAGDIMAFDPDTGFFESIS